MKSKLMMLVVAGTLTLGAGIPNAVARVKTTLPPTINPRATVSKRITKSAISRNTESSDKAGVSSTAVNKSAGASEKTSPVAISGRAVSGGANAAEVSGHAAVPPHTILPGAKNNAF